jgi:DDE superfamily endonuclease
MPQNNTAAAQVATKYAKVKTLTPTQFRRLTGVQPTVFARMLVVLRRAEKQQRKRGGKPPSLCLEDRLLLTLEYLREYRTYFHIGQSYGISESQAWYINHWVEDTLIKDGQFHLPGKKALLKSDVEIEIALVDVTESPVERPKKDNGASTPGRRSAIR